MRERAPAIVFTIVSRNYAAQAHVLMASVAIAEPEAARVVVVSDGDLTSAEVAGAEVITASRIAAAEALPLLAMSTYYDALELNTAIKPTCFQHLLKRADRVVYLDPDILLYRPLDTVWGALEVSDIALTPHLLQPSVRSGRPNISEILRSGAYNLGFLGLRRCADSTRFLTWWAECCRFDCRVDFAAGLFTDQRWVDLAPPFFARASIIRDPGLNVAYWNLSERPLLDTPQGLTAGGAPLRFFHFSGFNPSRRNLLSRHHDPCWAAPPSPYLAALLMDYAKRLQRAGWRKTVRRPYGFSTFPGGRSVTPAGRQAFLTAAREGRDLSDGLSTRQAAWLDGAEPSSLATPNPLTRLAASARRIGCESLDDFGLAGQKDLERRVAAAKPPDVVATSPATPWTGPAAAAHHWLRAGEAHEPPRALLAMQRGRADLASAAPTDEREDVETLFALCAGPEAAAGRFCVGLLRPADQDRLAHHGGRLAVAAAKLWAADLNFDGGCGVVIARYGLAAAGGWPSRCTRGLDALPVLSGGPAKALWRLRPDLRDTFDPRRALDRLRLRRWLASVAIGEYRLSITALPAEFRHDPIFRSWAAPHGRPAGDRRPPRGAWARLRSTSRTGLAAQPRFDPRLGGMIGASRAPAEVDVCIHEGPLADAALGWMSLWRQGIAVGRHIWSPPEGCAPPGPQDPAWSFVDAVISAKPQMASGPRPIWRDQPW